MFRFEHTGFFWAALFPALLVALYFLRKTLSNKDWSKWGSVTSNVKAIATQKARPPWMWLGFLAALLLTVAMVNPQWGYKSVPVANKTADIYILLDISNSMLAEDIAPSRLERARRFALDFSTAFRTDKVGLILFAGNAYTQSPLTTDWHAIQLFLNAANPDQAGTQGTAIGNAVRLVLKAKESGNSEPASHGAILMLTDGEDHDTDASAAIQDAAAAGWITYIIGVGTETGSTIPMSIDGRKDVKRDETGQPVKTALNRSLMIELARQGNGKYFDLAEGPSILDQLKHEMAGLERTKMEKRSFSEHKSYFQWFLLPALILVFILTVVNYKYDVI